VLADDSPTWKPQEFAYNALDCQLSLRYPVVKLQDYAGQEHQLADNPNPFALVTLAHLQTQATRKDPHARFEAMWTLVQLLYHRGWERQRVLDLLFMLDWMMTLPDYLSKALWQNIHELKQEKIMAYVSSFERFATEAGMQAGKQAGMQAGMQAGKQEGKQEGMQIGEAIALQKLLTKRFGAIPADIAQMIATASTAQIDTWLDQVLDAPNLDVMFGATCH
jgi:L-alanine-DL-glutamate epimerase-like enolase superfamily enzyme